MPEFEIDARGDLILNAITGWELHHIARMAMIIGIDYAHDEAAIEKEEYQRIAFVLSPSKALELAEVLKAEAERIIDGYSRPPLIQ